MTMETLDSAATRAVVRTVAYADVFDYPLTTAEIHRYLEGLPLSLEAVQTTLAALAPHLLSQVEQYYTLPGREALAAVRNQRTATSEQLWPKALRYGRMIARVPFVRMVAVTGALSVGNVHAADDLDYLIITAVGRLWVCRAMVVLLVRWAALFGDTICPNYFITERVLELQDRSLYTAHELAQLIPLHGLEAYQHLRQRNPWVATFLPNASGPPPGPDPAGSAPVRPGQPLFEPLLRLPPVSWLETWERERKIRKFSRQFSPSPAEITFSPDTCKGHFDGHGQRILAAYAERLQRLEHRYAA